MPNLNNRIHHAPPSQAAAQTEKPKASAAQAQAPVAKPSPGEQSLSKILDKSLLAEIKNAKMNPVDQQVTFGQKGPTDLTHVKLNTAGKNAGTLTMTPVGKNEEPQSYILKGKGGHLNVHLGKGDHEISGIGVKQWPPESVKFKDPDNGEIMQGFRVELSSGDALFIPKGIQVSINNDTVPHNQFNQAVDYRIDAKGSTGQETGPLMRYASVFALRY